jgi:hypothetical protein
MEPAPANHSARLWGRVGVEEIYGRFGLEADLPLTKLVFQNWPTSETNGSKLVVTKLTSKSSSQSQDGTVVELLGFDHRSWRNAFDEAHVHHSLAFGYLQIPATATLRTFQHIAFTYIQ